MVPTNLVYHWEKECAKYINPQVLRVKVLSGAQIATCNGNLRTASEGAQLLVVSYNTLNRCPALAAQEFLAVVLDEAHLIKNPRAATSRAVKELRGKVKVALTGTPIQNNVFELWSIFDFLMPGYLGS